VEIRTQEPELGKHRTQRPETTKISEAAASTTEHKNQLVPPHSFFHTIIRIEICFSHIILNLTNMK
jgi:hypothetical protein